MEAFAKIISDAFSFQAPQGWILFLAGAVTAVAVKEDFLIDQSGMIGTTSRICAIAGAVILVVRGVQWVATKLESRRDDARETKEQKDKIDRLYKDVIASLNHLSDREKQELLYLLERPVPTFRRSDAFPSDAGLALLELKIVHPANPRETLHTVARPVWERRQTLIKQWGTLPRAPVLTWVRPE